MDGGIENGWMVEENETGIKMGVYFESEKCL